MNDSDPKRWERIRTLAINHCQVGAESQQKEARRKIIDAITKKKEWDGLFDSSFDVMEVTISHNENTSARIGDGLSQPQIWISQAQQYLEKDEDLYVGWIKTDSPWHYIDKIHNMFNALQSISGKTGKLILPLEWHEKEDVIEKLKEYKFYSKTWWCEGVGLTSDPKPCGTCLCCINHKAALYKIKERKRARSVQWKQDVVSVRDEVEKESVDKAIDDLCKAIESLDVRPVDQPSVS
jgi:7-cyano-7-deazaguanine synthase in queuosine biosynthesis